MSLSITIMLASIIRELLDTNGFVKSCLLTIFPIITQCIQVIGPKYFFQHSTLKNYKDFYPFYLFL